jgi:hypothetical protein
MESGVELTDKALHIFFGLSCFFHRPDKFMDEIRDKTFVGENIGPDVKVLVPDKKVMVPDVKVLVHECGSKECVKSSPEMVQEKFGTFLRKMKAYS